MSDAADALLEPPPRPVGRRTGTRQGVPDVRLDDAVCIPVGFLSGPQLAARLSVNVSEVQTAIDKGLIPRRGRWFCWRDVRRELARQIAAGEPQTFSAVASVADLMD